MGEELVTPRRRKILLVAVAVNALVLGAYLWSRPGGTTTVRVVASGATFRAYVDGKLVTTGTSTADPRGGVGFVLPPRSTALAYPGPTAIQWVRVTDSRGRVLFEDSFDRRSDAWMRDSAEWIRRGGALWAPMGGTIQTGYRPWRDYVLEAHLSNVATADILLRTQSNGDAIDFWFRPFRDYDSRLFLRRGVTQQPLAPNGGVDTGRLQTIRSILSVALRPYPTVLLVLAAALVSLGAASVAGSRGSPISALGRFTTRASRKLGAALALAGFGSLLAINWIVVERIPHVPDEVAYLFQAKIFASGHLYLHVPQSIDHFAFTGFMVQDRGRWFSQYPFGHPLFLAVGWLVHAPWLVPPVVGALTLYCVYRLGAHLYGPLTGLLAGLLMLASPFFQMTASNFMSHNTASLCLAAGTLLFLVPGSRPRRAWFFSGLLLGFVLNIRPLTAAGVSVPFILWTGREFCLAEDRRAFTVRAGCLGAGAAVMVGAYLLYDQALMGSPLKTPYSYTGTDVVGFTGGHTLARGLMETLTNLSVLVLVLNGWPLFVGLLLPLLPFLLGTRDPADYFFLALVGSIAAAWAANHGIGNLMHGPRYWYEMVPFLMLLSARGVQRFVHVVGACGDWVTQRFERPSMDARPWAALTSALVLLALLGNSFDGWVLGRKSLYPVIDFVPRSIGDLRGFNFTDPRLLKAAEAAHVHHAVVFVHDCSDWWCYGSVFWTNTVSLDGDVVWARDLGPASDAALLASYPGRKSYIADYGGSTVQPLSLPGTEE